MYSLRPIEDGKYGIWLDNDLKVVVYDPEIAIKIICSLNNIVL